MFFINRLVVVLILLFLFLSLLLSCLKQVGKNFLLVVDRMKAMKDVLLFLDGMMLSNK